MGWRIVLALFLAMAVLYGTAFYGFIIITQQLAALHGWSSSQSGSLVSALWLMCPLALVSAPIINRMGAWRLLLIGLLLIAAAFLALSITTEFWQVYLLRLVTGAGKVFTVVAVPVIISQWFSRRFSLAIASAFCGGSFGGLLFAPATEVTTLALGWKIASLVLAGALLVVITIIALLRRHSVSQTKLHPETLAGQIEPEPENGHPVWREQISNINIIVAMPMAIAVVFLGIGALSYLIYVPRLLEAYGFSSTTAATLLGLAGIGAMAGNLLAGWTLDRMKTTWTSIGAAALIAVGLTVLNLLDGAPNFLLATTAVLLVGSGMGAGEILWLTLTKRQFGTDLFAVTYGGWSFFYQAGCVAGGSVGGAIFAATTHGGFLVAIALLWAPVIAFSLWRPGMRNEERTAIPALQAA
ncbi:MFS transporter [Sphingopyxis sp.]|uniref:MFS transporter n=1 Tax=Sphingopyxis sp. TaxID=1908224 RepID=UPI003D6CDBE3